MARGNPWQLDVIRAHQAGHITDAQIHHIADARLGRRAQLRTCRTCGTPTLTGLDADRAAVTITVDAYPLTALGEVWALRDGRRTYELRNGQLDPRTRWNIPNRPPAPHRTVLTTHRCHHPIPPEYHRPPSPRPTRPTTTEEAPF